MTADSDTDEGAPRGVLNLRARFEQLGSTSQAPARPPKPSPKPSARSKSLQQPSSPTAPQQQQQPPSSTHESDKDAQNEAPATMTSKRRAAPPPPTAKRQPSPSPQAEPTNAATAAPLVPPRPQASLNAKSDGEIVAPLAVPPPLPVRVLADPSSSDGGYYSSPASSPRHSPPLRQHPRMPERHPSLGPPAIPARPTLATRTRASSEATALLRPASASALSTSADFKPLPPPVRVANGSAGIVPRRPTISTATPPRGSDESSDEDSSDKLALKAQEYPDSTFANRRPPSLTGRHSVRSAHHVSCFAIRGNIVVTGHSHLSVWYPARSASRAATIAVSNAEVRISAIVFVQADLKSDCKRLWCGTKEGHLFAVDVQSGNVLESKPYAHNHAVTHLLRLGSSIVSIDDGGKVHAWTSRSLLDSPEVFRFGERPTFVGAVGDQLWTAYGPAQSASSTSAALPGKGPTLRIWSVSGGVSAFSLTPKPLTAGEWGSSLGAVTACAVVPLDDKTVYLAHDNGYVSMWDISTYTCTGIQRVSPFAITTMVGVGKYLWTGFRNGFINVYDVLSDPWIVRKAFKAHNEPVASIIVDPASLWTDSVLQVASCGLETVEMWNGFLRTDWMDRELDMRQRDFCSFRTLKALSVSWNVDAQRPADMIGSQANLDFFFDCLTSVDSPDIISFTFQELIDLENKKLTAKSMLLGAGRKKDQQFSDSVSSAYRQWHDKLVQQVRLVMPPECPYTVVHAGDLVGLFSCVFVKNAEQRALRDVALITVKTGVGGRYGNKGAILSRFVIDDTSICMINCHLAAGQNHRLQRDKDLADILETKGAFSELGSSSFGAYASGGTGTNVFDHEIVILSGDLNYRIDARRDAVIAAIESGSYDRLLAQDQLLKNMSTNQSFRLRSFKEPPIRFAPTYKYDRGTDTYDSGPKKRVPAWCDRILYRAADKDEKVKPLHYERYEVDVSDHKPISAAFEIKIKKIDPAKRALVWDEVERSWDRVEQAAIKEARAWYSRHHQ